MTLTWVDRNGAEEPLRVPPRQYDTPRVSPDGARVAVDITEGDNSDVWIWDLTRERLNPLTFDEATDTTPLWTPDSAHVVFASAREGGGLFRKAADGTGQVERLMDVSGRPYAWTGDQQLIFQRFGNIGVLAVEGEDGVTMLLEEEYPEIAPALSPDGQWLAYESRETGTTHIVVRPFPNVDDGRWNVSLDYGAHPVRRPRPSPSTASSSSTTGLRSSRRGFQTTDQCLWKLAPRLVPIRLNPPSARAPTAQRGPHNPILSKRC